MCFSTCTDICFSFSLQVILVLSCNYAILVSKCKYNLSY
nr:MAG TPA: hypothetical protein [Caudoviricetes sp.]